LPPTFHIYHLTPFPSLNRAGAGGEVALKHSHWFLMTYNGDETPTPQTEEGIEKAIWVKKPDIAELKKNMYPSIIDLLESVE
jgi:hypothetical protein